jgi:hypothetical protein
LADFVTRICLIHSQLSRGPIVDLNKHALIHVS